MVRKFGVIFAVLLVVLLLSNTNHNANILSFAQNTSGIISPNSNETSTSTPGSSLNMAKLAGGIKIISPGKDDLVPTNSNKSLIIYGVSKDNATTDCDVTIIVNNVKPYQNVQPTGIQGNEDYSTWQYTLTSNYTTIKEGSNKITSKIFCAAGIDNGGTNGSQSASQAYYSVNVTGSNFTQAQLANYELMLESAANSTNGGNSTLASSGAIQPVAQIQQFNQDTGNGPVCCKTTSALTTQVSDSGSGSGSSSSSGDDDDDDNDNNSNRNNDDDDNDNNSNRNNDDDDDDDDNDNDSNRNNDDDDDRSSSSSRSNNNNNNNNNDDDDDDAFDFSNRLNDFDFGFDFDTRDSNSESSWTDDSEDNSGVDRILDNVEDTMRSAGLDFSFS